MKFQLNKQPQEIRQKINAHISKIKTLNSAELLSYSIDLKRLKDEIGANVSDYLFDAIHLRTLSINSGLQQKQECSNQKMIKNFIKGEK